jgi:hypothetical protein
MKATELKRTSKVVRGQTLVMAMIILGVLLILGLVFVGIVNRNIVSSVASRTRSQETDLAEAGIRYAHQQLLTSGLCADWRGDLTSITDPVIGGNYTRDPDALYLRPGTGFGMRSDTDPQVDLGGPDGLGPYVRVTFSNGRALVRVRYAPSDFNVFSSSPTGSLLSPGKARSFTIIESVGRPGVVNETDPTTLLSSAGIQYQNFADGASFRAALGEMKNRDAQIVQSRMLMAFASIGIIEDSLYITNKYNVSVPAEIGYPNDMNVQYLGSAVNVPIQLGSSYSVYDVANPPVAATTAEPGGGSIYSNADLLLDGAINLNLNRYLGDKVNVAGMIVGQDNYASVLSMNIADWIGGSWTTTAYSATNLTDPTFDSLSANFSTENEVLRDEMTTTDAQGNPRSVPRKEPPSIEATDAVTGLNRYRTLTGGGAGTTTTGSLAGVINDPNGVYVGNTYDRQIPVDADGRAAVGAAESLVNDWLNPGNGGATSGWAGPYYVPPGAFVQLDEQGFSISLDGTHRPAGAPDNQRTWTGSNLSTLRFRIGQYNGEPYLINTLTKGTDVNATNPDFSKGVPFSGVLFFEGNVRIRGVIPTDQQLTLVSMSSIYIEGSISKGVIDSTGARLHRPSQSMLMLMAKDYVVLNTTQFCGPTFGQQLEQVDETSLPFDWSPIRLAAGSGQLTFGTELLLDPNNPNTTPTDPSTWRPFMQDYNSFSIASTNSGAPLNTQLLLSHTMDDGPNPNAFVTLDLNLGLPLSSYLFALSSSNTATSYYPSGYVTPGYSTAGFAPIYGLGSANTWQVYSKFESASFPIWDRTNAAATTGTSTVTFTSGPEGLYKLLLNDTSDFTVKTTSMAAGPTNDYILARTAVVPGDVRIEASMYAEEGSFFVIPGRWFNPNVNDTRTAYTSSASTQATRDAIRLSNFGATEAMPFYGEPLDVRILIYGSVSENMPASIAQQGEWLRKWGWIPKDLGASGLLIPWSHVPVGYDISSSGTNLYVPNLVITYDPALATGRSGGFDPTSSYLRTDSIGRPLPPLPKLPVSPTLSYFGEVNP